MKKFLFMLLVWGGVGGLHAMEPVSIRMGQPDSAYEIANSTISVSSTTVTTIAAVTGYRKMLIRDVTASTSFFYRLDGSTASITTVGMLNNTTETATIESNAAMYLQLANGVATKVFNVLTFRK